MTQWVAKPNPDYPGKGERPFAVFVIHDDGTEHKLDRQFNKQHTAFRYAYNIAVKNEHRRRIYVGD